MQNVKKNAWIFKKLFLYINCNINWTRKLKICIRILNIILNQCSVHFVMIFFNRKGHWGLNISEWCNSMLHVFYAYAIMILPSSCSQNKY